MARYGRDEFVFLFPQTDEKQVQTWAERLYEQFTEIPVALMGLEVRLSFSIGVASFDSTIATLDEILTKADRALYEAKKTGGNKFVLG